MTKVASGRSGCKSGGASRRRLVPLEVDLRRDRNPGKHNKRIRKPGISISSSRSHSHSHQQQQQQRKKPVVLDSALTRKILKMAEEQRRDEEEEEEEEEGRVRRGMLKNTTGTDSQLLFYGSDAPLVDPYGFVNIQSDEWMMELFDGLDLDDKYAYDEFTMQSMNGATDTFGESQAAAAAEEQKAISNLIVKKLRDQDQEQLMMQQQQQQQQQFEAEKNKPECLSVDVVAIYKDVAKYLSKYKSGKIPKAFKIVPRLTNWEEVLYLTEPLKWTSNAMLEATRIFASNLTPRMAQRFYNLVLLPAVRENIDKYKKLNVHYYDALKKALYKPSAWFQGILFPLLLDSCTLREIVIIGSIVAKVSIPVMHLAAALIRVCNLHKGNTARWTPSISYIIGIILNKKAALPQLAIDECVKKHFESFMEDKRSLPVIWHRTLLILVQRYKFDLVNHKRSLKALLKVHPHAAISPEIREELQRCEEIQQAATQMNFCLE